MLRAAIMSIGLVAVSTTLLSANTIFSDFTPGDFYTSGGDVVSTSSVDYMPSVVFNSGTDNLLTEVDFVTSIGYAGTDINQVTVTVYKDNFGFFGPVIASQEFDGEMGILGVSSSILTWTPNAPLTLNTNYYLTFSAPVPDDVTWNYNTEGQYGYYNRIPSLTYTNNTLGALDITGEFVPEPSTLALMGATALSLIGRRVRSLQR